MMERTTPQEGMTARRSGTSIQILANPEIRDLSFCRKAYLLVCGCSKYSRSRSYLYLRENSLEYNIAFSPCCGTLPAIDMVSVEYFDREPYAAKNQCYCCCPAQPKLEVVTSGCVICCINIPCDKTVVIMPFEKFPPPCCCCTNRVGYCDNCCNLCGQIRGNPKLYSSFEPQPKDPEGFVAVARSVMIRGAKA